ncbi:MAG: putative bifunctional diguanylate cyclase/phosphodiesterase, partial [Dehalococcoidia bacterium]
ISASGGIVVRDARDAQPADVLRDADIALYEAKAAGKGRAVHFTPSMLRAARRLDIETGLREAIERNQIRIGFQPIVDLHTGSVTGVEALARWMHPTRGMIQPTEFIPIAEESGLIVELWQQVVESACRSAIAWQRLRADGPPLRVSINISAGHLQQSDLAAQVATLLDATGFDPSSLILEITENALLQDATAALHSIRALKRLGIQLAIDDFGTGYSALSYLRRFPVDSIKIDRSFVRELPDDRGAAAIVKAICTLGQSLEMDVVVEGVERSDQLACVRSLGAGHAQGYYFARPLPAYEIPSLLSAGTFVQHLEEANPTLYSA